ncbi:hypothetical protein F5X98DRAFT_327202 [Xylaria grammica]|nr:hypothetical protein F5X98DRAFT_327202 [Xylaria grammica]
MWHIVLLGFLDVKMPLPHGEGPDASSRLLRDVIKKSYSHGVLATWYGLTCPSFSSFGLLLLKSQRVYGLPTTHPGFREAYFSTLSLYGR